MSFEIFEFLHNKKYELDGISGKFEHKIWQAKYPYVHWVQRLYHIPSEEGRKTTKYQEVKEYLNDNWDTDLTDDIERYCEVAQELGYETK